MPQKPHIDLMIIGAQKAGTTALKHYLAQHPQVQSHVETEFAFFSDDAMYEEGFEKHFQRSFGKPQPEAKVVGKNVAICTNEAAIERLHSSIPSCKIVFLIREPVARAISSYNMEVFNGWMHRPFEEVMDIIESGKHQDVMYRLFIEPGKYAQQIETLYRHFSKSQVRIYFYEDFAKDPVEVCRDIFDWMDINAEFVPDTEQKFMKGTGTRAAWLSRFMIRLRNNQNPVKRFLKWLLPYSWFSKLGNAAIDATRSDVPPKTIDERCKAFLFDYFKSENQRLKDEYDLDVSQWMKSR